MQSDNLKAILEALNFDLRSSPITDDVAVYTALTAAVLITILL